MRTESGDFDYPRAREGGLDAPFMSIYVPASTQDTPGAAKKLADELIDMVEKFAKDWPDKFALAPTPADVLANRIADRISLPMGMENGAPIEKDLANVQHFFRPRHPLHHPHPRQGQRDLRLLLLAARRAQLEGPLALRQGRWCARDEQGGHHDRHLATCRTRPSTR